MRPDRFRLFKVGEGFLEQWRDRMRRTPGGQLSFRLPLVKNPGVVKALVIVVQTLKDGFRFVVAISRTASELIGDRQTKQTQRGLVLGVRHQNVAANRLG